MLGWEFFISPRADAESGSEGQPARLIANWRAGLGGTEWVDSLVRQERAKNCGGNGYPLRYEISAATLLTVLESGIPRHRGPRVIGDDYQLPADYIGDVTIDLGRLRALPPDDVLCVEAWDQS